MESFVDNALVSLVGKVLITVIIALREFRLSLIRNHATLKPLMSPYKTCKVYNHNVFLAHANNVGAMNTMEFVFIVKLEMEHKSMFQLRTLLTILQVLQTILHNHNTYHTLVSYVGTILITVTIVHLKSRFDDDSTYGEDIDYVDASSPDVEIVSLEVVEIVDPEVGRIDDDILFNKFKDDILVLRLHISHSFLGRSTNTFDILFPNLELSVFNLEEIIVDSPILILFSFTADRSDFNHEEFAMNSLTCVSPGT
ncbi:hypothetical protein Tco_1409984 [Tanacetum coccineum]